MTLQICTVLFAWCIAEIYEDLVGGDFGLPAPLNFINLSVSRNQLPPVIRVKKARQAAENAHRAIEDEMFALRNAEVCFILPHFLNLQIHIRFFLFSIGSVVLILLRMSGRAIRAYTDFPVIIECLFSINATY